MRVLLVASLAALLCLSPARAGGSGLSSTSGLSSASGADDASEDAFVGDALGFGAFSSASVHSAIASASDGETSVSGDATERIRSGSDGDRDSGSGSLSADNAIDVATTLVPPPMGVIGDALAVASTSVSVSDDATERFHSGTGSWSADNATDVAVGLVSEPVGVVGDASAVADDEVGAEASTEAHALLPSSLLATGSSSSSAVSSATASASASAGDEDAGSESGSDAAVGWASDDSSSAASASTAAGSGSFESAATIGDHVVSGSQADSSASGSSADSPDVGDEPSPTPTRFKRATPTPTPTEEMPATATSAPAAAADATSSDSASGSLATREAQAKAAQEATGETNSTFTAALGGVSVLGCAAVVAIVVYVKRRGDASGEGEGGERMSSTAPANRESAASSVYNDPLGTRFSSIVMITPNGDGVCIL